MASGSALLYCADPYGQEGTQPTDEGGADAGSDVGSDAGFDVAARDAAIDVAAFCGDRSGLQAASAWPMPGYCPTLASRSPWNGPATLAVKWRTPITGAAVMGSGPLLVAHGDPSVTFIVVTTQDFVLHAFDAAGAPRWQSNANTLGAVGADGTVNAYNRDLNRDLIRIAPDGTNRVVVDAGVIPRSFILGGGGAFYIGAYDGDAGIRAFTSSGALRWMLPGDQGQPTHPTPVGVDGLLYFQRANILSAVAADGGTVWQSVPLGYQPTCAGIAGPDGTFYSVTEKDVYVVNPGGSLRGKVSMQLNCSGDPTGLALGPDGTLYVKGVPNQDEFDPGDAGTMSAVDPVKLTLKWTFPTGGRAQAPLVAADGTVYFGAADHFVYALAPDGSVRSKVALSGPVVGQLALDADGTLYVMTGTGAGSSELVALGP